MKSKLDNLLFSQSSIEIFNECKIKFKKRYLDGLYWQAKFTNPQIANYIEKGRLFHLLAYRYFSGIDYNNSDCTQENEELYYWMDNLKKFIAIDSSFTYLPEFEVRISEDLLKLQAKFDLIVFTDNKAIIYDWKVYQKPLGKKNLNFSLQTVIYRYMLARTYSNIINKIIQPESISMVYWQPNFPGNYVQIPYSNDQFSKDEEQIKSLISSIRDFNFESDCIPPIDRNVCKFCEFFFICNSESDRRAASIPEDDLFWDEFSISEKGIL